MAECQWHKFYSVKVAARPSVLFELLSDLPNYGRWLSKSDAFAETVDVAPYPVRLGSKYRDGKPERNWPGAVTGFQPTGSIDFHQVVPISQLQASVDVHIHYSLEIEEQATIVNRWLILDITIPNKSLENVVIQGFDDENTRTMNALKDYAEAHPDGVSD